MIDVQTGAQIAKVRAQRLPMLSRIGLGRLIWPWMWPLHMLTIGSKSQRIERTPGASPSITPGCGGEEPDKAIRRIGIISCRAQHACTLPALLVAIFTTGVIQVTALLIPRSCTGHPAVLYGPVIVEGTALLINFAIRPGHLMGADGGSSSPTTGKSF